MNLRNHTSLSVALLLSLGALSNAANRAGTDRVPEEVKTRALVNYGKLPLSFEENRGQADARVKFLSHGSDYSILLSPSEVFLNLQSAGKARHQSAIRMSFPGANSAPAMAGGEKQSAISSYFIGNDPAKWVPGAPNFARVRYRELYPGVDLAFYGSQGQLEYDFVVAPGANPRAVRLQFDGVDGMHLDRAGNLVLSAANGEIRQHKPIVYQVGAGGRQAVEGRYVIQSRNRVGFEIAGYDKRKPLVIDPTLTFATYLGSPGDEVTSVSEAATTTTYPAVAVDFEGNVYVAGYNGGSTFAGHPVAPLFGTHSYVFIVKMNATGTTLLYSVFFGGSGQDIAGGIAVDTVGNAYVTGSTTSNNFPTQNAPQSTFHGNGSDPNAFVTEVNAAGTLPVYSTYLGGSGSFWGRGIAVDPSGNAYVTGTASASSSGTAFCSPCSISSTPSSGFLTEVSAGGGTFAYSTYLPLNTGIGYGIAVDSTGDAYVTGTTGTAFAPSPGQGYVLKVNAGGTSVGYGPVILGNSGAALQTAGFGIALDAQDDAYVTGMTNNPSFPQITSGAAQTAYGGGLSDGFAVKLNPSGSLVYGTYIGGLGSSFIQERGSGIGVDLEGNAYVSGTTECIGFPTVNPISGAWNGGPAVLMEGTVSASSSNWSPITPGLTGSFDQVNALAFDPSGNLYAGASALNATGGGVYKLASGGSAWTPTGALANSGAVVTTTTVDAIAVDPIATSIVYAAGSGNLYQTTNGGTTWTQLAQAVGASAAIAVGKTSSSTSTVYVGSGSGLIYGTNAGSSWNSPLTPPPAGAINAIVADPNNLMTAYAGTPSGVYKTVDGGAHWAAANGGLPVGSVTSLAINASTAIIYAATPSGLYYSTNPATGWTQATLSPETVSTPFLVAVDAANNVYLAFLGSGIVTGTNGGTVQADWSTVTYNGLTQNQILALAVPPTGSGAYAGIVSAPAAFLTEISPSGQSFLSSTCIGGSDNNLGQNLAVTPDGVAYVSGLTFATNFPVTSSAIQQSTAGLYDAFAVRVDNVPFSDVPPSNAFFNFINVMYEAGITGGCATSPLQYCPNSTTTRGEMAVFIITAMFRGNSFNYTTTPYFSDVPASNGFFKFIQKMKDLGITAGCGSGNYCPNDPVTRGEMAVFIMVARYGTISFTYSSTPYFSDVPSSSSYFPFVQKMAQLGITGGCSVGVYCPSNPLTRGQMAVFIVTGLLDQLLPLTTPVITQAAPNAGSTGQNLTVTISGIGTNFGAGTQVAVPTGITASNVTVLSPTSLTVQLNISASAVPSLTATNGSLYTIAVTTGSAEADLPNGFTVQ
jgi:beta-propeller repeat-containing protein/S-layer family protein